MINIIAVIDKNRAIGWRNRLLFDIPSDMRRFKTLTMGHAVIMGRRTFESLPGGPLPGRRNIVVSKSLTEINGAEVCKSVTEALARCSAEKEVFIIGGGELYRQTISHADRLYLTVVDDTAPQADTWFPPYDTWKLVDEETEGCVSFRTYLTQIVQR